ncbi:MAG: hypothetical protein AAB871_00835, partial [Patescibacteria group bacterium]
VDTSGNAYNLGVRVGQIVAIICSLILGFTILKSKELLSNFLYILLVLLAAVLAYFGGALLGLLPIAYLTTLKSKSASTLPAQAVPPVTAPTTPPAPTSGSTPPSPAV